MNETRRYITLRDYLRVLRQQRWLILLVTVVFGGAALAYSLRQPTVYEAEASIVFQEPAQALDLLGSPVGPTQTPESRAAEGAATVTRPGVLKRVRKELKLDTSVEDLQTRISALAEAHTNFVVIQTEAPDPQEASALANEVARQVQATEASEVRATFKEIARAQRRQFEESQSDDIPETLADEFSRERIARLDALSEVAEPVSIVSFAEPPEAPVAPNPVRNGLLGALLGLTLGIVAAFVRDSLDRRLRGAREIEEHMGLPLVGSVSADALGKSGFASNGKAGLSPVDVEAFRILRTNLDVLDVDRPLRCFIVTSGLPEEGKSTVAASLAYAAGAGAKRTLLLECDLRRPALAERLSLEPSPGLTEFLAGKSELADVLQTVRAEGSDSLNGGGPRADEDATEAFHCITAGTPTPRPADLLGSRRFEEFLAWAREEYDLVLIDSSPLLPVADTLEIVPFADAVLVCVRSARTTRDEAHAARVALDNLPVRPTALVVTGVRPGEDAAYGHYSYTYAYGHQRVR